VLTVNDIRAQYPVPGTAAGSRSAIPGCYCVGGAFLLMQGNIYAPWPYEEILAQGLQRENPCLDAESVWRFAHDIIAFNDAGDFEAAWQMLGEALVYRK